MMYKNIFNQYDFNLAYAKVLVDDLNSDQMTLVPAEGLNNHPAWTLGHLIAGSADLANDLGYKFDMPKGWAELFVRKGPGDPRIPDTQKDKYPSKSALISELERKHEKVKELLRNIDKNLLDEPLEWSFHKQMPTLKDAVVFMCINHEAMHLGQLAAWRRAMGLESALVRLKK